MTPAVWFDSHCHFDFSVLDASREGDWQLASSLGVEGLLIPGVTRTQGESLSAFCAQNRRWRYALGLHPYWCQDHREDDLLWLATALQQPGVVAVGECGMDRVLVKEGSATWDAQWQWLMKQVELAESTGLPLVLHIRGAHDEVAAELRRRRFSGQGLVHAFSGSVQQAANWCDLGFCLGVGGAMTHPRAQRLRRTLQQIPPENLLLETDAPDMPPAFLGRHHNSPAMIPLYGHILSCLLGIETEDLAEQLQKNLLRVFPVLAGSEMAR